MLLPLHPPDRKPVLPLAGSSRTSNLTVPGPTVLAGSFDHPTSSPHAAMRLLVVACALALSLACVTLGVSGSKEYVYVQDTPFSIVKSQPQQRLVVFYFGSDAKAVPILDMVEETAEYLVSLDLGKLSSFQFAKVDCESEENKADCDEAGFKPTAGNGIWLFTSTPHEGIQAFSGTRDAATLATHIRHKFLPSDEHDVISFKDENDLFERMDKSERDPPKPIMVKFWETWCSHCKQLKLPYDQAAGFFKEQVDFMEVECSKNEETKAFCANNQIKSYPTLILFDGERKHFWDQADKSITSFQNFFLSTLPEDRYTRTVDKEAESLPPPPGGANKPEDKARPAASAAKSEKTERASATKGGKKTAPKKDASPAKKKKKAPARRDDDDEDDAPRRKRKPARRADDDEDDAPRRRRARRRDDDDEEEYDEAPRRRRAPRRRYDDDEDDEPRRPRKKQQRRRYDDDEEDEVPPPKKKQPAAKKAPVHDEL